MDDDEAHIHAPCGRSEQFLISDTDCTSLTVEERLIAFCSRYSIGHGDTAE